MDKLSPEVRSRLMSRIHGKDTAPEIAIRRILSTCGYRYRLHYAAVPGKPDIAFPRLKKAIFVHGCFWHGHSCPRGAMPTTRIAFWTTKLSGNKQRDRRTRSELKRRGWSILVIWECQLKKNPSAIASRIIQFLGGDARHGTTRKEILA